MNFLSVLESTISLKVPCKISFTRLCFHVNSALTPLNRAKI